MILLYYSVQVYFDQEPGTCSTYSCNEEILHGLLPADLCIIYIIHVPSS